ncbi:MAG TPA: M23 family metallopeptidase [Bacteroidales bacterium]|jgi:murein DD-endopeptidase MepM/ murein hydrolase activator NlpD|nr:M23 family metallopeptidase [Bacteroidales bacterium]
MKLPIYKFNKIKLQYDKIVLNFKTILIYILIQLIITIGLIFLLSVFFNTPKEIKLKKEINKLEYDLYIIDKKADGIYYLLQTLQQKDSIIIDAFDSHESELTIITPETVNDKLDNIGRTIEYNANRFKNMINKIISSDDKMRHYPAIQPVAKKDFKRISSGYSYRIHPIYKINKFHYGMDFVAPVGTPVYATADGIVEMAGKNLGYGNYVKINHGYDYETAYGHLNSIGVRKGQKVVRGQIIGTVGNTGISTGDHLHYEVIYRGKTVNPINYFADDITADEYQMMLRVQETLRVGLD